MKKLDTKKINRKLQKAERDFRPVKLASITTLIAPFIPQTELDKTNEILKYSKLRPLTLDDVIKIAYVHMRSISENDGYSPVARIRKYGEVNGIDWQPRHVAASTDYLIDIEFMKMISADDKKLKICRRYELCEEAKKLL